MPFSKDMALEGLKIFGSGLQITSRISPQHPLRNKWYPEATKHLSSDTTWGSSLEFNSLALWGIQVSMVQKWPGFKALIKRVQRDLQNWNSHLHEAIVGSWFWLAGCEGEFVNPHNKGGPDLKIDYGGQEVLVECRRSKSLTQQEQINCDIWRAACSEIVHYLKEQVPSAAVRFYPARDALPGDHELLIDGIKQKITSWRDYQAKNPSMQWGTGDLKAMDGSFTGRVVVADDPDKVFDAATEGHPGIEIPHETEAVSLIIDVILSDLPRCEGLWYAKTHTKRKWSELEEKVLGHLEEKTSQLNRYRKRSLASASYPSIVWVEHPAMKEGTASEINHLAQRISQEFVSNKADHFAAVTSVVLSNSRASLRKDGQLVLQSRFSFVSNPNTWHPVYDGFPYVTWSWWDKVESSGTPVREVMGKRMWLGSKTTGSHNKG
jgi:hypothetical protein